jgi:hypothetical protein
MISSGNVGLKMGWGRLAIGAFSQRGGKSQGMDREKERARWVNLPLSVQKVEQEIVSYRAANGEVVEAVVEEEEDQKGLCLWASGLNVVQKRPCPQQIWRWQTTVGSPRRRRCQSHRRTKYRSAHTKGGKNEGQREGWSGAETAGEANNSQRVSQCMGRTTSAK